MFDLLLIIDQFKPINDNFKLLIPITDEGNATALQYAVQDCDLQISNLIDLSNTTLTKSDRQRIMSMIIQDTHNKDVLQVYIDRNCQSRTDFHWQSRFRPKLSLEAAVRMVNYSLLFTLCFFHLFTLFFRYQ